MSNVTVFISDFYRSDRGSGERFSYKENPHNSGEEEERYVFCFLSLSMMFLF